MLSICVHTTHLSDEAKRNQTLLSLGVHNTFCICIYIIISYITHIHFHFSFRYKYSLFFSSNRQEFCLFIKKKRIDQFIKENCPKTDTSAIHAHASPEAAHHSSRRHCHPSDQRRHPTTEHWAPEPPLRHPHRPRGHAPA